MQLIHPTAHYHPYANASGGWGSAHSVMSILWREQAFRGVPGTRSVVFLNRNDIVRRVLRPASG